MAPHYRLSKKICTPITLSQLLRLHCNFFVENNRIRCILNTVTDKYHDKQTIYLSVTMQKNTVTDKYRANKRVNMNIIGRKEEQKILKECIESGKSEFLVVYGRRRVGKTFLVKEYFDNVFAFYATGVNGVGLSDQLQYFNDSLKEYGSTEKSAPKSWREAFSRLKKLLQKEDVAKDPLTGRKIVFLDELPWMDTPKSGFLAALDYFWNSWASSQKDIALIVCGSATSWIIGNILYDKGGLYNRITRQIHLMPFNLGECEAFYRANGIQMDRYETIQSYMIFGGIPYYMGLLSRRMSFVQNIDALLFDERGSLNNEYDRLFGSLFRNPEKHAKIINALATRRIGLTRKELVTEAQISDGLLLTKTLRELCECGFLRKYGNITKNVREAYYQIIDPFILFNIAFLQKKKITSWAKYSATPGYYSWSGLAFEIVCLNHVPQIKKALGISGVDSTEYAWRNSNAQIDLVIDRADSVINLCEVKFSAKEYSIDDGYAKNLRNKIEEFRNETKTRKAVHLTFITASGLVHNSHSGIVTNEVDVDDLFS